MGVHVTDSPIFIVGCPRSGTTLLRDLLRSHPHLTFPEESHFIPQLYESYGDPKDEREARKLAAKILSLRWVQAWELQLTPAEFAQDRSYARIVSRLYEAWALKENKPRWGDKTPPYVIKIPVLREIFPEAKIIHIYRDGRDVASSWVRVRFGPRNVFTAASAWTTMVAAGRAAGARLPPETYLEVCYESLVRHPRETMTQVCAFLGEPFTDAVLQASPLVGWNRYSPIVGSARPRKPRSDEIVATNLEKWKREMPLSDRILVESVAADLLETLGYETEGLARRITCPERWMWKADHWLRWSLLRLNRRGNYRVLKDVLLTRWADLRRRLRA